MRRGRPAREVPRSGLLESWIQEKIENRTNGILRKQTVAGEGALAT